MRFVAAAAVGDFDTGCLAGWLVAARVGWVPRSSLARVWACGRWRCTDAPHHKGTNLTTPHAHQLEASAVALLVTAGTACSLIMARRANAELFGPKCRLLLGFQKDSVHGVLLIITNFFGCGALDLSVLIWNNISSLLLLLQSFQIIRQFNFSRYIAFTIYMHRASMHSKNYELEKSKYVII